MATKLENLTIKLQSALDAANALPEAITLDTLDNPGSSATMLAGTEMLDAEGKKVTGSIASKSSSDLTASGATVTVPAGYYAEDASKLVSTTTIDAPTIRVSSAGLITSVVDQDTSGYVTNGLGAQATKQLDTQPATTITPTKSSQTAVEAGKYTTGAVTVNPIPDEYQDVSNVTATAARTAAGDVFVDADGVEQTGRLRTDRISITKDSDGDIIQDGSMDANIYDDGNVAYLSVNCANFGNTDPSKVLADSTFTAGGYYAESGTMPNNGSILGTLDYENTSYNIEQGYYEGGMVTHQITIRKSPSISVSSDGLITASVTQSEGYVDSGTESATKQLTVQAAQTITPGTSNKTIASGRYLTGTQTIKGDANLVPEHIVSGWSIFGVAGSAVTADSLTDAATVAF